VDDELGVAEGESLARDHPQALHEAAVDDDAVGGVEVDELDGGADLDACVALGDERVVQDDVVARGSPDREVAARQLELAAREGSRDGVEDRRGRRAGTPRRDVVGTEVDHRGDEARADRGVADEHVGLEQLERRRRRRRHAESEHILRRGGDLAGRVRLDDATSDILNRRRGVGGDDDVGVLLVATLERQFESHLRVLVPIPASADADACVAVTEANRIAGAQCHLFVGSERPLGTVAQQRAAVGRPEVDGDDRGARPHDRQMRLRHRLRRVGDRGECECRTARDQRRIATDQDAGTVDADFLAVVEGQDDGRCRRP
jgi:hypothetical protein